MIVAALVGGLAVAAALVVIYWVSAVRIRLAVATWRAETEARRNLQPDAPTWREQVRRLTPLIPAAYTGAGVIVTYLLELWVFVLLFAISHLVALLRPALDRIAVLLREDQYAFPLRPRRPGTASRRPDHRAAAAARDRHHHQPEGPPMTAATLDLPTFADAIAWVAKAVPLRPSQPVLGGIRMLFETTSDGTGTVTLTAFDYDVSHRARVTADGIVDPGEVLVPGHLAANMVGALRGDTVHLAPGGTDWGLTMKAARSVFNLPELPLAEVPNLPEAAPTVGVVDAAALAELGRTTWWAVGRDDMLATLQGLHLSGDDHGLTATATNRFVISRRITAWDNKADGFTAVAPGRELGVAINGLRGRVEVGYDGRTIRLTTEEREVTTRVLDVDFPKLDPLIRDPATCSTQVVVDVPDLVDALARARVALEPNASLQLAIADGAISITAKANGGTGGAADVVEAAIEGPPIEIGFNPAFLAEGLKSLGAAQAVIGLTGPGKPAYLAPRTDSDQHDVIGVVMPRRATS